MIGLLGDIHGMVMVLDQATKLAKEKGCEAVVQLGDFGFGPDAALDLHSVDLHLPVYALQGNHEDYDWLDKFDATRGQRLELRARRGSVVVLPRADILELDGRRFACLGGAGSIDKDIRLQQGWHWYEQEIITAQDGRDLVEKLGHKPIDALLTHCPPQSVIQEYFERGARRHRKSYMFGVSPDWRDPSADVVEALWNALGYPPNFCGHMHESVQHGTCRVLNINELIYV